VSGTGPTPGGDATDRLLLVWIALGILLSLVVGIAAGVLGWFAGQGVAMAVLTSGVGFGGTLTLVLLLLSILRR
jgi:hypothetical protein